MAPTRFAIPGGAWVPFLFVAVRSRLPAAASWPPRCCFLRLSVPPRCCFLRLCAFLSCSASYNSPLSLRFSPLPSVLPALPPFSPSFLRSHPSFLRSHPFSSVSPPFSPPSYRHKKTGRYFRTSPLKIKLFNRCNVVARKNGGLAPRQSSQAAGPLLVKADVVVNANCVCYYCCYDCHYHKCCHHNQFFLSQIVNSLPPKGQLKFNFLPGVLTTLLLNCTAKVRIVCEHSNLFALIFPSAPSFLVYINPLDMRQSVSTQRNSSEFLWRSD